MNNLGKKLPFLLLKKENKKENNEKSLHYFINGSALLKEQLSFCNYGQQKIPLRSFTAEEIITSTNGFQESVGPYLYKGNFNEKKLLVKKYERKKKMDRHDHVIRDIVISSEMSYHKNVLKIIGYCLEFERVALVYEYSQFNYLFKFFSPFCENFLTWEKRVKIAIDVASVILYLHTEFPTPVIHRNLTSSNVILDQNGVVKLYNFECCIPLPIGKVKVQDDLIGTIGYLDPEYVWSSNVTLKSDVFSFGLFLLMLLSGKEIRVNHEGKYYTEDYGLISLENYASKCVENNKLDDNLIDSKILQVEQKKLKVFLNLALKCAQKVGEDRPNMIDVAKELQKIKKGEVQELLPTMECLLAWN
ncbi:non-functional pseudokinase ZED1-like [Nicotiana sylvestris]|uniref:non-functional pseudokinase ZED1-like n=1 Tax=Nicotiana sylvestris TaxID=4096 RepID=UPI00388C676C